MWLHIFTDERTVSPTLILYILTIDSLDICWDTLNVLTDLLCVLFSFLLQGEIFVLWCGWIYNLYKSQMFWFKFYFHFKHNFNIKQIWKAWHKLVIIPNLMYNFLFLNKKIPFHPQICTNHKIINHFYYIFL